MSLPQVQGIGIASVYAIDYHESFVFYHELLELNEVMTMSEHSCYFKINDTQGLYLIGQHKAVEHLPENTGTTFALSVRSIQETFSVLKHAGTTMIQPEAMQMNDTDYWFQCYDPSGNIVEFIGPQ